MCQDMSGALLNRDEYSEDTGTDWWENLDHWYMILDTSCMMDGETWGQYMSRIQALLQGSRTDCVFGITSGRYIASLLGLQTVGSQLTPHVSDLRAPGGDSGHYFTVTIV